MSSIVDIRVWRRGSNHIALMNVVRLMSFVMNEFFIPLDDNIFPLTDSYGVRTFNNLYLAMVSISFLISSVEVFSFQLFFVYWQKRYSKKLYLLIQVRRNWKEDDQVCLQNLQFSVPKFNH